MTEQETAYWNGRKLLLGACGNKWKHIYGKKRNNVPLLLEEVCEFDYYYIYGKFRVHYYYLRAISCKLITIDTYITHADMVWHTIFDFKCFAWNLQTIGEIRADLLQCSHIHKIVEFLKVFFFDKMQMNVIIDCTSNLMTFLSSCNQPWWHTIGDWIVKRNTTAVLWVICCKIKQRWNSVCFHYVMVTFLQCNYNKHIAHHCGYDVRCHHRVETLRL